MSGIFFRCNYSINVEWKVDPLKTGVSMFTIHIVVSNINQYYAKSINDENFLVVRIC